MLVVAAKQVLESSCVFYALMMVLWYALCQHLIMTNVNADWLIIPGERLAGDLTKTGNRSIPLHCIARIGLSRVPRPFAIPRSPT